MSQLQVADNNVAADTEAASSAYVPPLQRTAGQPPPIAAHGGLSYMAFSRNGDAGTTVALRMRAPKSSAARSSALIDTIDNAPPGPIETRWGLGFRGYDECMDYIRANGINAPEGGVALPLRYTVYERSTSSRRPVQCDLAGPGTRRFGGDPARQRRARAAAAATLFPTGDA